MEITDKTLNTLVNTLEWTLEAGDIQAKSEYYGYSLNISNDMAYNYNSFTMELFRYDEPIEFDGDKLLDLCQNKAVEMEMKQEDKYKQEQIYRDINWYN